VDGLPKVLGVPMAVGCGDVSVLAGQILCSM
jgi:hypothetical protein